MGVPWPCGMGACSVEVSSDLVCPVDGRSSGPVSGPSITASAIIK